MSTHDPTKRIPKSLGTDAKLFGTYTLTDLAVALFPGVVVILLTQVVVPSSLTVAGYSVQAFTLPLAALAIAVGVVFVYLTPSYATSLDWLETFVGYQRSEKELTHDEAKAYTQLERVYPRAGAIERTDGTFIGMVQVDPPSMALATDAEWRQKAESFQDFLNTTVEFPIQIFSTTQQFPVEEYLGRYEARLTDPDVKSNPRLSALIENYIDWYSEDLDQRRMTIRDHYVIITVTPADVQFERESLMQKLAALPFVGLFVRAAFAPRIEEQREAMFDTLDERLRRVETGLRGIEGCGARRIPVEDATQLIGEFWAGESREYGDMQRVLRTRPLVGGAE
ncbi:hypothetical protein ACFQH3_16740 [Haladaptatus sp. GCM10025707]|uniref:hypothetical protein n=1 Tax=unclassified Haladaptatus TaxID=2622732 RepID=UPI0023E77AB4|nr:hypothetical protein [Haladaptatus sp. QDMS2]